MLSYHDFDYIIKWSAHHWNCYINLQGVDVGGGSLDGVQDNLTKRAGQNY